MPPDSVRDSDFRPRRMGGAKRYPSPRPHGFRKLNPSYEKRPCFPVTGELSIATYAYRHEQQPRASGITGRKRGEKTYTT
jgi:hypothetical protein